jgi:predicted nucleic acid-binding protein
VKFWDASALVPLLVAEASTRRLQALAVKDAAMLVWWGSEVECISALARLERDGTLQPQAITAALQRLRQLATGWHEVDPNDAIREAAARFLRVHPLRAADALQLAAAFLAAERRPASLEMVTLDDRLAAAARKEGFPVINPGTGRMKP